MLLSLNEMMGFEIQGVDDDLGQCQDFLFDDDHWTVRYMVVDTNKWLPGSRKVLISPISFKKPDWRNKCLPVALTREGIKNSPELDAHKPISRHYEIQFFNYYGYGYYWMGEGPWGTYTQPAPLIDNQVPEHIEDEPDQDEHLRSAVEVNGYDILATDGSIGHVEDFILNDDNWSIVYVVVDTRNWLPGGRKVLVSPSSFESINWVNKAVTVNLTTQQIKDSPEFDADALLSAQ